MKVKYIYSACIEIDVNGFRILTDPWFTDGAYDGSWFLFPKVDPFKHLTKPDLIYISHIHPDHYDPEFLKALIQKWGPIPILIPDLQSNYLLRKGMSDGLELTPTRYFQNDLIEIHIEENDTGSKSDIDSALLVIQKDTGSALLNLNDCIYHEAHTQKLRDIIRAKNLDLDLLALGYTGAGPFPQCYYDIPDDRENALKSAEEKKQSFFDRYRRYAEAFSSKWHLPFAGEYLLGGQLTYLNPFRGVADAVEVTEFDDKAVVFHPGGEIDLQSGEIVGARKEKYSDQEVVRRCDAIESSEMDYEVDVHVPFARINFQRYVRAAVLKATAKSEVSDPYLLIFTIMFKGKPTERYTVELLSGVVNTIPLSEVEFPDQHEELFIDYRYFFGLLIGLYHWNNAEVGSHFMRKRFPADNFRRDVYPFLNFMSVC